MSEPADLIPISMDPCPVIERYKQDVDLTLIRENLRLTPEERIRKMMAALELVEAIQSSTKVPTR